MEAGEVTERGQVSAPAALWGHWDFMLLWGGQTISELGSSVTQLALPLTAVLVLKAIAFQFGLLTAATYASFALIALPAGAIVDRIAKRRLLVVCDAARMLIIGSVPVAAAAGALTPGLLYARGAIGGVLGGGFTGRFSRWIASARIVWLSSLLFVLCSALRPLAEPGWRVVLFGVGGVGITFSVVLFNVAQLTYRQVITPPALLGRMNAAVRWIVWGTLPLGGLVGGALGTAIGIRPTL